jgi:hypothetical protein
MRKLAIIFVLLAVAISVADCSSAAAKPAVRHRAPAALTQAQGAEICSDLNAWIIHAVTVDQPRLYWAIIVPAGADLQDTQLGTDLSEEMQDLQQNNSLALQTAAVYNSQGIANTAALSSDCAAYGQTLNWTPGGS